ncbi:MAG: hypothetical protein ACXVPK_10920, partial [Tumebacillaceae bacterium]
QDVKLFVTETVVHEAIHVLARCIYALDMLAKNHTPDHYSSAKQREITSRYERQFMSITKQKPSFTPTQKQACRDILRKYNTLALRALLPFLNEFCGFLPSSTEQLNTALELCVETPLHSSDAMIAAAASHDDFGERIGLITLDRDLTSLTGVKVYFTEVNNHQYDLSTMREQLGLAAFSFDT